MFLSLTGLDKHWVVGTVQLQLLQNQFGMLPWAIFMSLLRRACFSLILTIFPLNHIIWGTTVGCAYQEI